MLECGSQARARALIGSSRSSSLQAVRRVRSQALLKKSQNRLRSRATADRWTGATGVRVHFEREGRGKGGGISALSNSQLTLCRLIKIIFALH